MGKKSKRNRSSTKNISVPAAAATTTARNSNAADDDDGRVAPAFRKTGILEEETKDNLRFEDPYIDEYEVEEDMVDDDEEWEDIAENEDENIKMSRHSVMAEEEGHNDSNTDKVQTWNPFTDYMAAGETLEMDPAAYKMYHALSAEWPALSFDFLRDDYGESRTRFPHTLLAAFGTQANRPEHNQLTIMKVSDMAKMPIERDDDILGEEINKDDETNTSDNDSDSDEDDIDLDPVMEHYSIQHYGGVNRVRVLPQKPEIVATWSDTGKVNLFSVESIIQRLTIAKSKTLTMKDIPTKPFFSYNKHGEEGYAMDWSRIQQGQLVTGACNGSIHIWTPRPEGEFEVAPFFDSKKKQKQSNVVSVEDLQWSPTEATVFASAECSGYVRIFDTRAPNRAMLSHKIHSSGSDVNVLSWNKLVTNLLATGGDDGTLSVWDLRHFNESEPKPLARFTPHKTPITSVEWHPTDESMLAASDETGSYIYDLSVEEDDATNAAAAAMDVPPQLLFVHSGSEQFKEIHWHPQITSCLMTTALSGFSIFIPSNL